MYWYCKTFEHNKEQAHGKGITLTATAKIKDKEEYQSIRDMFVESEASGSKAPTKKRKAPAQKQDQQDDPKKAWIKWTTSAVKTSQTWQTANQLLKDQLELRKNEDWCSHKIIESVSNHYDAVAALQATISKQKAVFSQNGVLGEEHEATKKTYEGLEAVQNNDKGVIKRAESLLKVMG